MQKLIYKLVTNQQELKDAFSIREVVFIDEQQVPKELEMDEYDNTATHFIVYDDKRPVATARMREYHDPSTVKIERVAVLKDERGKGIGKKLMTFIEQEALKMGFKTLRLNAQRHAETFYKDLGYMTISEAFDEAGIEHVTMEKKS
ncbi:GNAT family N-acetyltransferase [Tepidibacillus decaturensis]|uniref:Acetyltransferase n=1 Tax=Tepidibacillus decaturensis TaxID=1413211 RepID=A0A135L481_9BACI|nr:GNAT family N-acetyltransferase [Tepidibacillus decaturensis]KXG43824.1 acetyltransferase [Tepidibacillus decaturensis]